MEQNKILFDLIKEHKWKEFIEYLKDNEDIDVNIRDNSNNYLINYAILLNNIDVVSILIHRGSRLDITDADGRSILYVPIKYSYKKVLNLLLHFNKTNIGISLIDMKDKNDDIPLHYATNNKNIEFIKLLLDAGSDVNVVNNKGLNSLHMAVYTRSDEICKMILEKNVNINARTETGETCLHIACNFQLKNVVRLLVEANIDLNMHDYNNEFTSLHYTINLNNIPITSILLKAGADPNIQDFFGNTALHYAIIEENYELMVLLLESQYTKNIINLNLYNIDSKLPIHILFEKKDDTSEEYLGFLLFGSKLNFQDIDGYSSMHHLSMNKLWKNFKDILKTKKIDIFIKNKNKKRPIDYVDKDNLEEYINLITESYIYILQNHNYIWKESWENMCKKELFKNKITKEELKIVSKYINVTSSDKNINLCSKIIKKKLLDIITSNEENCGYTSFPAKLNKKCIKITEGTNIEYCTFTGITLDVLTGLIYLLDKHPKACSTLTASFVKNKKLCNYYKSIGIITNTKCEFLNFEIVWVYQKLYLSENFAENFSKCIKNKNKKFIIIPLGIELRQGSHANYLIYDKQSKEIERFEPYGSHPPYKFDYNPSLLDKILKYRFSELDPSIIYIRPFDFMPKIAFQLFDVVETKTKKIGDPGGFCALWSIWYTDMRLTYFDIKRDSLVKKMIKSIMIQNISFKNLIRNYSIEIIKIRDKIFKKVGVTVNDWLNDQYTEEQLVKVIEELTQIIMKYIE